MRESFTVILKDYLKTSFNRLNPLKMKNPKRWTYMNLYAGVGSHFYTGFNFPQTHLVWYEYIFILGLCFVCFFVLLTWSVRFCCRLGFNPNSGGKWVEDGKILFNLSRSCVLNSKSPGDTENVLSLLCG